MAGEPSTLFRSVDTATFAAGLTARLRIAGIEVGMSSAERFGRALVACPAADTATLYWVARTCLVHDCDDFPVFDAVFAAIFDDEGLAVTPGRHDRNQGAVKSTGNLVSRSDRTDDGGFTVGSTSTSHAPEIIDHDETMDEIDSSVLPELLPAAAAHLADTPFDQLEPHQLDALGAWLEEALIDFPHRRSRRLEAAKSGGQIDLRRTVLMSRSTVGEPLRLQRRRRRTKPRNIVVIADVSGSMQSFTRIYLHLMRSLVAYGDAEVFTFTTSLRRVTPMLRRRDPRSAIDALTAEVEDRFSGTRIGASIGELVASPIWSNAVRGAVVLIASDGWDVDPPDQLAHHMARLQRMAHRVAWLNPRTAADDYQPLVAGMAAALPHIDDFMSGHTLNAMRDVLGVIGGSESSRPSRHEPPR